MAKKKKVVVHDEECFCEDCLLVKVEAQIVASRKAREAAEEQHTLTVFDTRGDYICDIPFSNDEWKMLQQAAIQMFVKEALRQMIKRETGEDFG